jgi:hypothetical protein
MKKSNLIPHTKNAAQPAQGQVVTIEAIVQEIHALNRMINACTVKVGELSDMLYVEIMEREKKLQPTNEVITQD